MSNRLSRSRLARAESPASSLEPGDPTVAGVAAVAFDGTEDGAARLTEAEYERWLLPSEPRDAFEKAVHWMSLGAGVAALTLGMSAVWMFI